MIEHKNLSTSYEMKNDPNGTFSGLGAVFGNIDFGGDIIVRGAFDKTLADIEANNKTIPILWQHDPWTPIGVWESMKSVDEGLQVDGHLLIDHVQQAREAHSLMKAKAVSGLSIGFRIPAGGQEWDDEQNVRVIKEIDLHEVSIVTFPMNDEARIDAVKAAEMTQRQMERVLTNEAKLSRTVARQLMSGGFKAIHDMQDAEADVEEIEQLLKRRSEILTQA